MSTPRFSASGTQAQPHSLKLLLCKAIVFFLFLASQSTMLTVATFPVTAEELSSSNIRS